MDYDDAMGRFSERVRMARQKNAVDVMSIVLALDERVGDEYEIPSPHDLLRIAGNRSTGARRLGVEMGRVEAVRTDHHKRPLAHLRAVTMRPVKGEKLDAQKAADAADLLGRDYLPAVLSLGKVEAAALKKPFLAVVSIETCLLEQVPAIASQVLLASCVAQPWIETIAINVAPSQRELEAVMDTGEFEGHEEEAVWQELKTLRSVLLAKLDLPRPLIWLDVPRFDLDRDMSQLGAAFTKKSEPKIPPPSEEDLVRMGASIPITGKVMFEYFRMAEGDDPAAGVTAARRLGNQLVIADFEGEYHEPEDDTLVNLRASLISASIHSRALAMTRALTRPGSLQDLLKTGRVALGISAVLDIVGSSRYEVSDLCEVAFGSEFEQKLERALQRHKASGGVPPE